MLFDSALRPLACWISASGTVCGSSPFAAGRKNASARAEQRLDRDQLPDLDGAREDQRGQQRVQREAHEIGHDHHAVARQPVGPHAAEQQECDQRQARRREHEPEIGRAARQFDHEQRQRDDHDAVADHARRLRQPEVAEVAMAQHAQLLREVAHPLQLDAGPRLGW